jgi:HSP20 family molecular chaperone IbpA
MPIRKSGDWMWAESLEMLERAERLQRQLFQLEPSSYLRPTWEPPVDIYETEKELWIIAVLPGVARESIKLQIESGALILLGARQQPIEFRGAKVHRMEMPQGRFERRIELPVGQYELDEYKLTRGCLILPLRKI